MCIATIQAVSQVSRNGWTLTPDRSSDIPDNSLLRLLVTKSVFSNIIIQLLLTWLWLTLIICFLLRGSSLLLIRGTLLPYDVTWGTRYRQLLLRRQLFLLQILIKRCFGLPRGTGVLRPNLLLSVTIGLRRGLTIFVLTVLLVLRGLLLA